MANVVIGRRGFGQVEPNHLSGIVTGQIYAQLPVDKTAMGDIIENGRFAKYDYAAGKVDLAGNGEWMLIYNEEKNYDERKQGHKDFAMKATDMVDGEIVPRLIKTNVGDILTTNAFGITNGQDTAITGPTITYTGSNAATPDVAGITIDDSGKSNSVPYQFAVTKATGYLGIVDTKTSGADNTALDMTGPIFELVKIYTMADGQPGLKLVRIK